MSEKNRGIKTRESILRVAAQLFTVHGYHDTSLSDILGAVAISKGAFYHHFKSKEEMALAVLDEVRDDCAAVFQETTAGAASSGDHLAVMLRKLADLHSGGEWTPGMLLARLVQETSDEEGMLADHVREAVEWLLEFWEGLVQAAQDGGRAREDLSCEAVAGLILSAWFGAVGLNGLQNEAVALDTVLGQVTALLEVNA